MTKGDIILIPFPFTDLSGTKNRPGLVLYVNNTDAIVSFISTQIKGKDDYDIILNPTKDNGLKKVSIVRLSKIATLNKGLIIGRLGSLNPTHLKEVDNKLINLLKLEKYFKD
jgi:mRNA interferase MazF